MARAIKNGWNLTPEQREEIKARCLFVLRNGGFRDSMTAAKTLLQADHIDVLRERNEQDDSHQSNKEAIAALRARLASPEGQAEARELLSRLRTSPEQDTSLPDHDHVLQNDTHRSEEGGHPARAEQETEGEGGEATPTNTENPVSSPDGK